MGAAALAGAVAAPRGADDRSASPARSGGKARPSRGPMAGMAIAGTTQACLAHEDCDDGQGCTAELCSDGVCLNPPIPDCISCMGVYICPPVEIVFVMDTSGSMRDEAAALCGGIEQLVTDLYGLGISVTPRVLGITEAPVDAYFSCLSSDVVTLFGGETPGLPESCAFPNTLSAYESWGPATAIVAEHFPWTFGSVRLVVPMSDEGPCDGSRPAGCNDPGDDRASIDNAISVALAGGVIVSPIAGTGSDACVVNLATAVANATGGIVLQSQNASLDLTDSITEIILNRCSFDDRCDDQHVCTTNDRCIDTVCVGTPIKDCQPCLSSSVCDDDDGCTNEECVEGMCVFTLTYDDSTECCAPATGTIAPLDDGDPCTLDSCDPLTGAPSHPPSPQGVTCVDGRDCTLDDRCDGQGQCAGDDAGTVECTSDADCFGFSCDPQTQRCSCGDTPELCLVAVQGALREEGCFTVDEPLSIDVRLGSSSHTIVGAQFLIEYDPAVLDLVQIEPGSLIDAQSPFTQEIFRSVNEHEGKLFYAVGVDLGGMGTRGPAILARLHFQPLEACTRDELCFLSQNPQRTILTNEEGHQVLFTTCCTGELSIHGTAPWLTCPLSRVVNADAGTLSATLGWAAPAATATCGAGPTLACSGDNTHGADVAHLISNGGRIPAGETAFHCSAEDDCGLTAAIAVGRSPWKRRTWSSWRCSFPPRSRRVLCAAASNSNFTPLAPRRRWSWSGTWSSVTHSICPGGPRAC
jgi:hypothetical protein